MERRTIPPGAGQGRCLPLLPRTRSSSTSEAQARFAQGAARYRTEIALARSGAMHLGTTDAGAPLYLQPKLLRTHTMVQGPTGAGKSFLARILFRELVRTGAAIYVDDPKHDFLEALEEDCAALRLDDQVTIFDTSSAERTIAFNPLKKNGIRVEDQTAWLLSAIRSCFRQESFDLTPQRPRWMANALIPVIEGEGTFDHVLAMLNFQESTVRKFFVGKTTNALVRQEWLAYEELSMTRKRDETYSSYGWLRKFCLSDTLRRIFAPSSYSFNFAEFLTHAGIMLQSFPRFRPLDEDATQFLRSLSLYSLLAQAFHIPPDKRPPLVIILDESEHVLSRDSGVIATILREGRGLGVHLVLLFHEFAEVAAHNPGLLETVLNGCRTKFIGGHLTQSNLEVLTSELFTTAWHPHIVRDEIYTLEVEPVETTRVSYSRSRARSLEHGCSYPYSETDGSSTSETVGESAGSSAGLNVQRAVSRGQSRAHTTADGVARTVMVGTSDSEVYGESHMSGEGYSSGAMDAHSAGMSAALGTGMTETWDPQNPAAMFPNAMTTSLSEMAGMSSNDTHAESRGYHSLAASGESYARGTARTHAEGTSRSHVEADAVAASEALMHSLGASRSFSHEQSNSMTTGQNSAVSRGVTPSVSVGESFTESETVSPFHELRKRWRVASREFLSLQDFLTTKLIKVKSLATAHWVVQTPQGKVVFFRALWVKSLMGGRERLAAFRANVGRKPWYQRSDPEQSPTLLATPMKDVTPQQVLIPEVLPPEEPGNEAPDDFSEPSNDDFLEP